MRPEFEKFARQLSEATDLSLEPWQMEVLRRLDSGDEIQFVGPMPNRRYVASVCAAAVIAEGHTVQFVGPGAEAARQAALARLDELDRALGR